MAHDEFRARGSAALVASAAFAVGVGIAVHHPTCPWVALAAFALWCAAAAASEGLWLFMLPACLPAANFAPWTGWIVFDEFDLVVIGAAAAGYARRASLRTVRSASAATMPRAMLALALLCAVTTALAFVRGVTASEGKSFGWYDGYADPLNALRVAKSALYVMLLSPLLWQQLRRPNVGVVHRVATGMITGTTLVVIAVLWERAAYPGLFDFSKPYRTVALFWEMQVGGAAIDGYLAMAVPFVAWAVRRARVPLHWMAAATLALLVEYVCLTTYSRGVFIGVFGSMAVLGVMLASSRVRATSPPWRGRANAALIVVALIQGVVIVGSDSFMLARVKTSVYDLGSRILHWNNGLRLLHGPADWWLGKGLGRLPIEYAASVAGEEFSGEARITPNLGRGHLYLSGPNHTPALAGLYALTQRVTNESTTYRTAFDARVDKEVRVGVSVCEAHLLYEHECQRGVMQLFSAGGSWQHVTVPLEGPRLRGGGWPYRTAVFSIALLNADSRAELDNFVLSGDGGANLLRNADFSRGLAHWFPVAKDYYIPWHIDNVYLEALIERGIVGATTFALLLASALTALLSPRVRELPIAPFLAASLVGALLVGMVSSLLDVPRVAFLLFFLACLSIQLVAAHRSPESN